MFQLPKKNSKKYSRQIAFTLIEILIVISVIALIMGLLSSAVNTARKSSKKTACRANLRSLNLALNMYLDDNQYVMPNANYWIPNIITSRPKKITHLLLPYLTEPEVFKCPADTRQQYYLAKGSSYRYNYNISNKHSKDVKKDTPILFDYRPFHGSPNNPTSVNYLYIDGYIGKRRVK